MMTERIYSRMVSKSTSFIAYVCEIPRDYLPNDELDRYDERLLDDRDYRDNPLARMAAERALNRRDVATGRRLPEAALSDDESEFGEVVGRRVRRRMARGQFGGEDEEMFDIDDINLNNEELRMDTDLTSTVNARLALKIRKNFREFLRTFIDPKWDTEEPAYLDRIDNMAAENKSSLPVIYEPDLLSWSPKLCEWIADLPSKVLPILHDTALQLVRERYDVYKDKDKEVFIRVQNFPVMDQIRNLRGYHVNRLVNVTGVVTRRTTLLPCLRVLFVDCLQCGFLCGPFEVLGTDDGRMPAPNHCSQCQSRGPFQVNREEAIYRNFQRITIQESPGSVPAGRMPRSKEIYLTGDLVDSVRPGDMVEVVGTLLGKYDSMGNARSGFPVFKTFIEANSIKRKNELKMDNIGEEELKEILQLSKDPTIRDRLIASIAPSVYGEKHVKTSIAMAMFGGVPKVVAGQHKIRGDINILILGDPGMAKSQCLKYVEKTSHKAVFTTGKGASAAGLTASVKKDNQTGEYVLEGGAMVLADSGICLIDEFDKMSDQDRTAIHEAMEQQTISISKAGIVTTLSSRCSVIAAANPLGGRYDSQLSFGENVDLSETILSRFDCLCVLKDEIDVFKDEALADFVLCSHMANHPTDPNTAVKLRRNLVTALGGNLSAKPVNQDILKRYVLYAKTNVTPRVNDMDKDKISQFYAEMREEAKKAQGIPMTARHLESIVRMAEANARMELRDYVTDRDVDYAIATALTSFVSTQKHQVAEKLRRKFETKYITAITAHNELLHFLLKKLIKKKMDLHLLSVARTPLFEEEEDSGNSGRPAVTIPELKSEATKMDIPSIEEYLESDLFLDAFEIENGNIMKRNDFDGGIAGVDMEM
jgi:DNA replication licensing factor MCM2